MYLYLQSTVKLDKVPTGNFVMSVNNCNDQRFDSEHLLLSEKTDILSYQKEDKKCVLNVIDIDCSDTLK